MWVAHCHTCKKDLLSDIANKKTAERLKNRHADGKHEVSVYKMSLRGVVV